MKLVISDQAREIYVRSLPRSKSKLLIIQAILDGYSIKEIIDHKLVPNLSIRTIFEYYRNMKELIND